MVASQGTAQSCLEAHSCICSACCSTAETWWLISGTEPLDHQSKKGHLHCESAGAGKGVSNTSISTLHSQNHPNTCDISACKLAQGWLFATRCLVHCLRSCTPIPASEVDKLDLADRNQGVAQHQKGLVDSSSSLPCFLGRSAACHGGSCPGYSRRARTMECAWIIAFLVDWLAWQQERESSHGDCRSQGRFEVDGAAVVQRSCSMEGTSAFCSEGFV